MLDLFCGVGGASEPFLDHGWDVLRVDIRDDLAADVVADVRQLPIKPHDVDLIWGSPPCREVSRYRMPWYPDDDPNLELFEAFLSIVDEWDPTYWVMENVQGLHDFYGEPRLTLGPFWLWGEFPLFSLDETPVKNQRVTPTEPEQNAKIPYVIGDGLRRSIEGQEQLAVV